MLAKDFKAELGQSIFAKVVDQNSAFELIVSVDGNLLRVVNKTGKKICTGDKVELVVSAVNPVRFSLAEQYSPGRFERKG